MRGDVRIVRWDFDICVFVFVATQTRAKRNNWICEAKCIEIGVGGTGERGRREPRESIVSWLLVDSWLGGRGRDCH